MLIRKDYVSQKTYNSRRGGLLDMFKALFKNLIAVSMIFTIRFNVCSKNNDVPSCYNVSSICSSIHIQK